MIVCPDQITTADEWIFVFFLLEENQKENIYERFASLFSSILSDYIRTLNLSPDNGLLFEILEYYPKKKLPSFFALLSREIPHFFYRLAATETGRTFLANNPALLDKITSEGLNAVISEGANKGETALYWLAGTEMGRALLTKNPSLLNKITSEGLNAVTPEGADKGKTALYWLAATKTGGALLANNPSLLDKITSEGLNAVIPAASDSSTERKIIKTIIAAIEAIKENKLIFPITIDLSKTLETILALKQVKNLTEKYSRDSRYRLHKDFIYKFSKKIIQLLIENHPIDSALARENIEKGIKEAARTFFFHRHWIKRLIADSLLTLSSLGLSIGISLQKTGDYFLFSNAKTARENAFKKIIFPLVEDSETVLFDDEVISESEKRNFIDTPTNKIDYIKNELEFMIPIGTILFTLGAMVIIIYSLSLLPFTSTFLIILFSESILFSLFQLATDSHPYSKYKDLTLLRHFFGWFLFAFIGAGLASSIGGPLIFILGLTTLVAPSTLIMIHTMWILVQPFIPILIGLFSLLLEASSSGEQHLSLPFIGGIVGLFSIVGGIIPVLSFCALTIPMIALMKLSHLINEYLDKKYIDYCSRLAQKNENSIEEGENTHFCLENKHKNKTLSFSFFKKKPEYNENRKEKDEEEKNTLNITIQHPKLTPR